MAAKRAKRMKDRETAPAERSGSGTDTTAASGTAELEDLLEDHRVGDAPEDDSRDAEDDVADDDDVADGAVDDSADDAATEGGGSRTTRGSSVKSTDTRGSRKKSAGKRGSGTRSGSVGAAADPEKGRSRARRAAKDEARTASRRRVVAESPNPAWLAPTAVVLLIAGLAYLVVYYISSAQLPLPIGDWNLVAGFGLLMLGGGMLMFWK